MKRRKHYLPVLLCASYLMAFGSTAGAQAQQAVMPDAVAATPAATESSDRAFTRLTDEYLEQAYLRFSPSNATSLGLHQYDTQLEDYSTAANRAQVAQLHIWLKRFEALPADELSETSQADLLMLVNFIKATLLDREEVRYWQKNPDLYSSGVTSSIYGLIERPYAPIDTRLKAAIARERLIPKVLLEARANLKNPPHVYTEIAIQQISGNVSFFEHDVPDAFRDAQDHAALAEFGKTNAAVVRSLKAYAKWLKTSLLPRSNGDFRFGADIFAKSLAYYEMVDIPLDQLLKVGLSDLHKNQAEFARVAKEIDPNKKPEQELVELASQHPSADRLLDAMHDRFNSEVDFIVSHHVITLPSSEQPVLQETPPFMRATTSASMDAPGPFETGSTTAYFNVTLPDPSSSEREKDEYLSSFNIGTLVSTSVHEAFPGHFVQFLWRPQFASRVRTIFGAATNIEGWAHYCEQMMLDQGYTQPGSGPGAAVDRRTADLIHLGQLQDALLRDARFVVAIRMHTGIGGAMSIQQAEDFFVSDGYQSRPLAEIETKRGTVDALYLYYTLGKLEIMKLREDVAARQGSAYSIGAFHDAFMKEGFAPIKIIRRNMLHDDSPVL